LNYRKEFERCFDWIDSHLKERITVTDLANEIGYTVYHFCRIFYVYQGMTPMEYVLNRRLQAALVELSEGRKIIDIACEYGFETASGFSKAVKLKYGKTPTQLKNSMLLDNQEDLINNITILTEIKEIESFVICGYCVEMDFDATNYSEEMIAYWNTFEENNIEEQLYKELNPHKHGEIGIVIRDGINSGKHKYLLGVMKRDEGKDTSWSNYQVSGGKYIVITTPPVDMTVNDIELSWMVKKVWKYIFNQWFETVDFQFDEVREAFEYYDERCHYRKDAVMNIYIPIK
jgi:AraC family transcriptional regulator